MGTVTAQLPADWLPVPTPGGAEFDAWAEDLRARSGADHVLEDGLTRLRERISVGPPERRWLAVVPTSGAPRIAAVGWFAVREIGNDVEGMRSHAKAGRLPDGFLLVDQAMIDTRRRGRDVVGLYRLLASDDGTFGARMVEWVGLMGYDSRTGLTIDFEMSTTDVTVFDDLTGAAEAVVADLDLGGVSA
jgi:hypothetical protein